MDWKEFIMLALPILILSMAALGLVIVML